MFTSQLNPYATLGVQGGVSPFATQPFTPQSFSPLSPFGGGSPQLQSPQNILPLQQVLQLLQIVPQQLQQLQQLQQQHHQQLQHLIQYVPQQLQQIQHLIQYVPQQIQQLQQQLQAQQSFGPSALQGSPISAQFANPSPFGWSAGQSSQVM